ncbi:hypothetical protein [Massilia oculi]|uniref:hypothetical protein n=1 Tax=Massilia oculi TaxID=945844 RepID=UPI001AAEF961|nr:hypothetical protein [Massilia oculi]
MDIPTSLTLIEALNDLSSKTARTWSRAGFFHLVVELFLPLRGIAPDTARPVIAAGEDGFVGAQLPYPGRRLTVLSTPQIKDLWIHGECLTRSVALEPGEPGYLDWSAVKARRKAMDRPAHTSEAWNAKWPDSNWHDGEFMGECGVSLFDEVVRVTDETCRVPRETVEELLAYVAGVEGERTGTLDEGSPTIAFDAGLDGAHSSQVIHDRFSSAEHIESSSAIASGRRSEAIMSAADRSLACLFEPVTLVALERIFPAGGQWKKWGERAARNGLHEARQGRGLFNPYLAAMWFLRQGESDWDLARCHRVLVKNLPARSRGEEYRLTGLLD